MNEMIFQNHTSHANTILTVIAISILWMPVQATADDELDRNREVSYLVFDRARGFDTPSYTHDYIAGTITARFRRISPKWASFLDPQVSTQRKRRFFKRFEEIRENGSLVGIKIYLGVGSFTMRGYVKRQPTRWVLRVGDSRTPPTTRGLWAVPIVPYADMIEEDTDGRQAFVRAELEYAAGELKRAAPEFQRLRMTSPVIAPWATIREADCLIENNQANVAADLLRIVAQDTGNRATRLLARARLGEITGMALGQRFPAFLYRIKAEEELSLGIVADELKFREGRIRLFRGDINESLTALEELSRQRNLSAFVENEELINAIRWRALTEAVFAKDWLRATRIYVNMPWVPKDKEYYEKLQLAGAMAFEKANLPERAITIYLALLQSKSNEVSDKSTVLKLANAYFKAGDNYRARVSVEYLIEQDPKWRLNRDLVRLKGELAIANQRPKVATTMASELMANPKLATNEDTRFVTNAALATLEEEGVVYARSVIAPAAEIGHELPVNVAHDLAFTAGDCDYLARACQPIELASGKRLLWTAACLSKAGRLDEAMVFLEATQAYAATDLIDPELWSLVELIQENAEWWELNKELNAPKSSTQGRRTPRSNTTRQAMARDRRAAKPAQPDMEVSS